MSKEKKSLTVWKAFVVFSTTVVSMLCIAMIVIEAIHLYVDLSDGQVSWDSVIPGLGESADSSDESDEAEESSLGTTEYREQAKELDKQMAQLETNITNRLKKAEAGNPEVQKKMAQLETDKEQLMQLLKTATEALRKELPSRSGD